MSKSNDVQLFTTKTLDTCTSFPTMFHSLKRKMGVIRILKLFASSRKQVNVVPKKAIGKQF